MFETSKQLREQSKVDNQLDLEAENLGLLALLALARRRVRGRKDSRQVSDYSDANHEIRVSRPVINPEDFDPVRRVLRELHVMNMAEIKLKSRSAMAETIFDSKQYDDTAPYKIFGETGDDLKDALISTLPTLGKPIEFEVRKHGSALFGNPRMPFLALAISSALAYDELRTVRDTIVPGYMLRESGGDLMTHERRPHISLCQIMPNHITEGTRYIQDKASEVQDIIQDHLPRAVSLGAIQVTVDPPAMNRRAH